MKNQALIFWYVRGVRLTSQQFISHRFIEDMQEIFYDMIMLYRRIDAHKIVPKIEVV